MTIEITIRYNGNKSRQSMDSWNRSLLTTDELQTVQFLIGGFFFLTDRSPLEVLQAFYNHGFKTSDFQSFEFQA
jgi:hypothetical protein